MLKQNGLKSDKKSLKSFKTLNSIFYPLQKLADFWEKSPISTYKHITVHFYQK